MGRARALFVIAVWGVISGSGARAEAPPDTGARAAGAPQAAPAVARKWKPLRSPEATATSFLQNNWNRYEENYHPSYVLDDNPATAWVEGVAGFGEGQAITLPLSTVRRARAVRLRIWNGYQKSLHLWTKNAMPSRVAITVLDAAGEEVVTVERELERVQGPQEVLVDLPAKRGLSAVRLKILAVYQGEKYDDTCISDIDVDVDSDVTYNAAAEKAKLAALAAWIAERKATAAYFATKPREFPFAFTKFVETTSTFDKTELKKKLAQRDELTKALPTARFKIAAKGLRALPDGLTNEKLYAGDFADLLKLDAITLRETNEPVATHTTSYEGLQNVWTSTARVSRDAGGKNDVRVLAFDIKDVTTERTTDTRNRDLLLVYDGQGRLGTVYRTIVESDDAAQIDEEGETRTDEIWSFSYDDAGKVQAVQRETLGRSRRVRERGLGRERENRRATRVVYKGVVDRSS